MPYLTRLAAICIFSTILFNCSGGDDDDAPATDLPPENTDKATINQGVWGNVWFWEGNHLPGIAPEGSSGTITPVVRKVHIYQTATLGDVTESPEKGGRFYSAVNTALVAIVQSD